ncbi:MAG: trypsin-like peptidase domain-containing protein [Planctomycetota bacterium]
MTWWTAARRTLILVSGFVVGAAIVLATLWLLDVRVYRQALADANQARDRLASIGDLSIVFRDVSTAIEPSVVDIITQRSAPIPGGGPVEVGNGSGVIIEVDGGRGWIVTNNHVVANATGIVVTLADGREFTSPDAQVIGTDPPTDLAVIEISAPRLIAADWGESERLGKGDWVVAFGSPFGYVGSMTAGIVSELGRNTLDRRRGRAGVLGRGSYEDFIQTDAAINPGNSGGPLVDLTGRVVGINTAIASRSGGFDGIGFAIPESMARPIVEQLKDIGRVRRGWLGVTIDAAPINGAFIRTVYANTPAAAALEAGDIVTAVNGETIFEDQDLRNLIASMSPGTAVTLEVVRDEQPIEVRVTLGELPTDMLSFAAPPVPSRALSPQMLGFVLADPAALPNVPNRRIVVGAVRNASPAARAGLRPGDAILEINGIEIDTPDELLGRLADIAPGESINLTVATPTSERIVTIRP